MERPLSMGYSVSIFISWAWSALSCPLGQRRRRPRSLFQMTPPKAAPCSEGLAFGVSRGLAIYVGDAGRRGMLRRRCWTARDASTTSHSDIRGLSRSLGTVPTWPCFVGRLRCLSSRIRLGRTGLWGRCVPACRIGRIASFSKSYPRLSSILSYSRQNLSSHTVNDNA